MQTQPITLIFDMGVTLLYSYYAVTLQRHHLKILQQDLHLKYLERICTVHTLHIGATSWKLQHIRFHQHSYKKVLNNLHPIQWSWLRSIFQQNAKITFQLGKWGQFVFLKQANSISLKLFAIDLQKKLRRYMYPYICISQIFLTLISKVICTTCLPDYRTALIIHKTPITHHHLGSRQIKLLKSKIIKQYLEGQCAVTKNSILSLIVFYLKWRRQFIKIKF